MMTEVLFLCGYPFKGIHSGSDVMLTYSECIFTLLSQFEFKGQLEQIIKL